MNRFLILLTIYGNKVLTVVSTIVVVTMLSYSGVVLYDTVYTNRAAFASWDLTQYRPVVAEEEPSFETVQAVNKDTCAWITLPGTHIDYPVVQGKDDVEYSMKDIYGKSSLTGSIYLTVANSRDFTNSFNLIYGHHMDNGAMFGDIDKYVDSSYFKQHQDGYLVTSKGVYDLHVFARLSADVYDSRIYSAGDRAASEFPDFLYYVKSLAVQWDSSLDIKQTSKAIRIYLKERDKNIAENGTFQFNKMSEKGINEGMQLIAFSTCADAETNGRQLLVATMKMRTEPLPQTIIEDEAVPMAVWGHGQENHWALLNLICLAMILLILIPGLAVRKKYRDLPALIKQATKKGGKHAVVETVYAAEAAAEGTKSEAEDPSKGQLTGAQRRLIGIVIQIIVAAFSVFWFIWTEDPHKPMIIVDRWTLAMIVLFAITWYTDVYLIKYQKVSRKVNKIEK